MALNKVSQAVLDAVLLRLSDATTGLNAGLTANSAAYGISPTVMSVDWSDKSTNFMVGQIDPVMLEESGFVRYPYSCLYILESGQTGVVKFSQFSGVIRAIFDVYMSWPGIHRPVPVPESCLNCIEDAVIDVINRVENQNWPNPLVYNGQIQVKRGGLAFGAKNWKQRIGFSMLFELHQ